MAFCPNCDAHIGVDALACPECQAEFTGPGSWKPKAKTRKERTGWMTFFGETPNFDYDADEYTALIQEISRQPVDPAIGLPVFGALFGFSILAMGLFDWALAVLVLFPLLFLFPYYVVQLMMQWRMRNHLKSTLAQRVRPTYIPSDSRGWASVYIGVWFATTGVSLALLQLMKR